MSDGRQVTSKERSHGVAFQTRHSSLVTRHFSHYCQCLKAFFIAFGIASAILLGSCADPLEKPPAQEASEKFQRGIRGEGTLGPMDRTDDPYVKPSISDTHP